MNGSLCTVAGEPDSVEGAKYFTSCFNGKRAKGNLKYVRMVH